MFDDDPNADMFDNVGTYQRLMTHVHTCTDDLYVSEADKQDRKNRQNRAGNRERVRQKRLLAKLLHRS